MINVQHTALDMSLRFHESTTTPETVVATARTFEKYLRNDREYANKVDEVTEWAFRMSDQYKATGYIPKKEDMDALASYATEVENTK